MRSHIVIPPCLQTEQLTIFYLGQGKTELQDRDLLVCVRGAAFCCSDIRPCSGWKKARRSEYQFQNDFCRGSRRARCVRQCLLTCRSGPAACGNCRKLHVAMQALPFRSRVCAALPAVTSAAEMGQDALLFSAVYILFFPFAQVLTPNRSRVWDCS